MKTLAPPSNPVKRERMLSTILNLLKGHPSDPLPDEDARLALGALAVRVLNSADTTHAIVIPRTEAFLARMNGLGPVDAAKMRATCEKIEAEAPSTRKFAPLVRETVNVETRIEALEALWHVLLADGTPPNERDTGIAVQFREALGLNKAHCESAKARAAPF